MSFWLKQAQLLAGALLLAVPGGATAHHSRAAFDLSRTVAVEGKVTEVSWTNPHYYFTLLGTLDGTEGGPRTAAQWTFEGHSVPGLVRNGWTRHTLQIGQRVRVVANPNRQPDVSFALLDHVTRADGKTFYSFRRPPDVVDEITRAPLQPSTDFSGTWRLIRSLRANLVGGFAPPEDWPLTDQARREVSGFDINDDPSLRCEPRGLPRMLAWPYAQRWQFDEAGLNISVEHSTESRRVSAAAPAAAPPPSSTGYAYGGRQPDGTLVIHSRGYTAKPWGNARGISSSAQKSLVEKYELLDGGYRMKLTYELSDPVYLQKPVAVSHEYAKVHDFEFAQEPECDLHTATRHLQFETGRQ